MRIGQKEFDTLHNTYIMGILNVTPDSFFDGGKYTTPEALKRRVETLVTEGADLIDVGGESTRPGFTGITAQEEIERVLPAITYITEHYDVPVSIDTTKAEVALESLKAGAALVNDIRGFRQDEEMARITAQYDAACCLMSDCSFSDLSMLSEGILADYEQSLSIAEKYGVRKDGILLDPGIGFHYDVSRDKAKRNEADWYIMKNLDTLKGKYPMLLAHSNKSFLRSGSEIMNTPLLQATLLVSGKAAIHDVPFLRVHEVGLNKEAVQIAREARKKWTEG